MLRKSASRSFRFSFAIKTEQNKTSFNMLFIIFKLLEKKPSLKFIFRPSPSKTVTVNKLLNLLTCKFSVVGSNLRREEEKTYKKFVKYCREVFGKWKSESEKSLDVLIISFAERYYNRRN